MPSTASTVSTILFCVCLFGLCGSSGGLEGVATDIWNIFDGPIQHDGHISRHGMGVSQLRWFRPWHRTSRNTQVTDSGRDKYLTSVCGNLPSDEGRGAVRRHNDTEDEVVADRQASKICHKGDNVDSKDVRTFCPR